MGSKRIRWGITAFLLMVVLSCSISNVYARYREAFSGDFPLQAKPLEELRFSQQNWHRSEDGYDLTFSVAQTQPACRVFLAVSEGISQPEKLQVLLTLPGDEDTILMAQVEQIPDASALGALFGTGYVSRFLDPETGEELVLELTAETNYTLTILGLESAAEQTSLLRLFVECVPEA